MLPWFKSKQSTGLVGAAIGSTGIGLSHIRHEGEPKLTCWAYQPFVDEPDPLCLLEKMLEEQDLTNEPLTLVLPSDQYHLHMMEAPQVEPDEIKDAIRWKIKDLIDYNVQEAVVDYFPIYKEKPVGRPDLIYAVTTHRKTIDTLSEWAARKDYSLVAIDINEMAIRNVVNLHSEDTRSMAFVIVHTDFSVITLYNHGHMYMSRRIEVGYRALLDNPSDTEYFMLEIQRSQDYYYSHFGQAHISHLFIAPSEMQVDALPAQLAEHLELQVASFDLLHYLSVDKPFPPPMQSRCLTAIGAALREEALVA